MLKAKGGQGSSVTEIECSRLARSFLVACLLSVAGIQALPALGQEPAPAQTAQPGQSASSTSSSTSAGSFDLAQGKRLFQENCAQCHGVDGSGGDGPDLHGVPASLGDDAVRGIIRRGIAGTPMPGSSTMSDKEISMVVVYLRSLGGTESSEKVPGDPAKGEALYNSSGCSACHMIEGKGGSVGPELTRIGATRGASNLKARLINPGDDLPQVGDGPFGNRWAQYLMFRAVDKDGSVVEGVRVGEDSFTIVLKDAAGKFHGFWKPDLRSLEKEPGKSFMPSFKDTLSSTQMDDLVAYLMTLTGAQSQ
jgi:cytochrome c oxidase cbb3-type subunit III